MLGGFFDWGGDWERERGRLHHDTYHYRFYHYLGNPDELFINAIATVLTGVSVELPVAAVKAFRNWRMISRELRDLIERAPQEATTEPEALLARLAVEEVSRGEYSAVVTDAVRERAEAILKNCEVRNAARIEEAIAESRRLVTEMDAFVASFDESGGLNEGRARISLEEARQRVLEFLDNCRKLDRELSAIPSKLRTNTMDVEGEG